jgi:hypothetical protein
VFADTSPSSVIALPNAAVLALLSSHNLFWKVRAVLRFIIVHGRIPYPTLHWAVLSCTLPRAVPCLVQLLTTFVVEQVKLKPTPRELVWMLELLRAAPEVRCSSPASSLRWCCDALLLLLPALVSMLVTLSAGCAVVLQPPWLLIPSLVHAMMYMKDNGIIVAMGDGSVSSVGGVDVPRTIGTTLLDFVLTLMSRAPTSQLPLIHRQFVGLLQGAAERKVSPLPLPLPLPCPCLYLYL